MSVEAFMVLALIGFLVGGFGALAGIGGGVILAPLVALYYGLPMHQAIGVSLVCVIATSTATSALYVEQHITDIRLGMTLELATTLGALIAALMAHYIDRRTLALMFACFLAYTTIFGVEKEPAAAVAIVTWLITFAACSLAGAPLLVHEGFSLGKLKQMAEATEGERSTEPTHRYRERGGIGIRAGFRSRSRKGWEFESPRSHEE